MRDWSTLSDSDILAAIASEENRTHVLSVMDDLEQDPNWTDLIKQLVVESKIETRCVMSWLAEALQPANYLEIGVRRGFTMAMVVSRAPHVRVWGFDMWIESYAGSENPGPGFVASELSKIGYRADPVLLSGNSHELLPVFFDASYGRLFRHRRVRVVRRNRPKAFDLILVDGDHSLLGAYEDLMAVLPHLAVGGVIVFDDIAPDPALVDPDATKSEQGPDPYGWNDLLGVWRAAMAEFPSLRTIEYTANTPGIAIAMRMPVETCERDYDEQGQYDVS